MDNPYESHPISIDSNLKSKSAPLLIAAAFLLAPLISCVTALPLFDYGNVVDSPQLTLYFMLGGHALTLILVWCICKWKLEMGIPAAIALAILYVGTAGLCWLIVTFGVISWT